MKHLKFHLLGGMLAGTLYALGTLYARHPWASLSYGGGAVGMLGLLMEMALSSRYTGFRLKEGTLLLHHFLKTTAALVEKTNAPALLPIYISHETHPVPATGVFLATINGAPALVVDAQEAHGKS